MKIWAIADLHLAISTPQKTMEVFGPAWTDYHERIRKNWEAAVGADDLVLLPGDITWAHHIDEAVIDFHWIDELPGTKVMCKGNHDYWWVSNNKLEQALPPSIHFVHNSVYNFGDVTIGGTRLWDTPEYNFEKYIDFVKTPQTPKIKKGPTPEESARIFERELERLERSLSQLNPDAKIRIAMIHYPPIGPDLKPSRTSAILEKYKIDHCVFGHLHNIKPELNITGDHNGVHYHFVAGDHLKFDPLQIV